jgi:hypothetical protein
MNRLELLSNEYHRISAALPWVLLLMNITLLLAIAWLVFFAPARTNPRWRALLWRLTTVGLVLPDTPID